jgi:hypothetical protein
LRMRERERGEKEGGREGGGEKGRGGEAKGPKRGTVIDSFKRLLKKNPAA